VARISDNVNQGKTANQTPSTTSKEEEKKRMNDRFIGVLRIFLNTIPSPMQK
jgi:hypothetical protein